MDNGRGKMDNGKIKL